MKGFGLGMILAASAAAMTSYPTRGIYNEWGEDPEQLNLIVDPIPREEFKKRNLDREKANKNSHGSKERKKVLTKRAKNKANRKRSR